MDLATRQPYPSSQPYLGNLLEAFKDNIKDDLSKISRPNNNFDKRDIKFWYEFMAHEYPNRASHQYWNSPPVRKLMNSKPLLDNRRYILYYNILSFKMVLVLYKFYKERYNIS